MSEPTKIRTDNIVHKLSNDTMKPLRECLNGNVIFVNSISELLELDLSFIEDNQQVSVKNYHIDSEGGGGVFYWDSSKDKLDHNGGTIIDPDVVFPSDWSDTSQQETWFTAVESNSTGVFIRIYDGANNVKYFGAKGDGVIDDTIAIQKCNDTDNLNIFISTGTYLITSAIKISNNTHIYGEGVNTKIIRNDNNYEYINDNSILSCFYVTGRHINLSKFSIYGNGIDDIEGLSLDNVNLSNFSELEFRSVISGIKSYSSVYLCNFTSLHTSGAHGCAFDFSCPCYDTSLNFNGCWVENSVQAYHFKLSRYCIMNSCGADYINISEDNGNPHTAPKVGDPSTGYAIYHFEGSLFTLNSIAAENFYGNGLIYGNGQNTTLIINNPVCVNGNSEYISRLESYPYWCSAPITSGTEGGYFIINVGAPLVFSNTLTTGRVATVFGYNYSDANGIPETPRVFINATGSKQPLINGQSSISLDRDTRTIENLTYNKNAAISNGTIDNTSIGDTIPSSGTFTNIKYSDVYLKGVRIDGTGTKIIIPINYSGSFNQSTFLKIKVIEGCTNSNSYGGSCEVMYRYYSSITALRQLSITSDISSITSDGMNLIINLSVEINSPTISIESLGDNHIDYDNISIST